LVPAGDQGKLLGSGNARLCLQVDDIEHALRDLHERGIPTTPAENKGTGILASLHDPDGNEICLWQYLSSPSPVVADL
jgi:predicted enzyme related to lactoylglutathione lyase